MPGYTNDNFIVKFFKHSFSFAIISLFVAVPVSICTVVGGVIAIFEMPFKMIGRLRGIQAKDIPIKVQVINAECSQSERKEDLLFVHGWPDSGALWDKQVKELKKNHNCIVLTMSNYGKDGANGSWGMDFPQIHKELAQIVEKYSPDKKVTIICHDWGSAYSLGFQKTRPDLVHRMVCVDVIGGEKTWVMIYLCAIYQWFNVFCYLISGVGGKVAMKMFLKTAYKARPYDELHPLMSYSYYYLWKDAFTKLFTGNFDVVFNGVLCKDMIEHIDLDKCPLYFAYATKNCLPGCAFHQPQQFERLVANKNCKVEAFDSDHWIPFYRSKQFNESLKQWLK